MAYGFNADFDTPQTASGVSVSVTGHVPANTDYIEVMQLTVSRYATTELEYFSLTKDYSNTTTSPSTVSENLTIAVVPKIVTTTGLADSVSFTSIGSLKASIDFKS